MLTTKQLAGELSEEEGMHMRANILMAGPGKGGGQSEQGEEMLQGPASPAGVFFTSVQCMQYLNIRTLPDSLGLSVPFDIIIFHMIWKLKLRIYQHKT